MLNYRDFSVLSKLFIYKNIESRLRKKSCQVICINTLARKIKIICFSSEYFQQEFCILLEFPDIIFLAIIKFLTFIPAI